MLDILLFLIFFLLVVLTVPIGYALGIAAMLWIVLDGTVPVIMIPQRMYAGIDSFPLIAIPFFILAGKIMASGGISDRLIRLASVLVGMFKGGLAYVNIVAADPPRRMRPRSGPS
jgi:C4-dicarboxylate transporter DctM subunit